MYHAAWNPVGNATVRTLVSRLLAACLVLGIAVHLAGCQTRPDLPSAGNPGGEVPVYRLGPGDKIRVTVYQREALSGLFEIDSIGRLSLPLIRGVQAGGLSVAELEDVITARLKEEQFIDPKVSVDLIKTRPVCVLGEVNDPGCFDYSYGMRAAAAIANSGGYTYRARKDYLVIIRGSGEKLIGTQETLLYPGDVIDVDERLF